MSMVSQAFAGLAAALHVVFFLFESVLFRRPAIQKRFHVDPACADSVRSWAFNQGFYNLFLAAGVFAGFALLLTGHPRVGLALVAWNCLSMVGAAVVLVASAPQLKRGALIQGAAPLLFIILAAIRGVL